MTGFDLRFLEQFIDLKLLFTATEENHILLRNMQKMSLIFTFWKQTIFNLFKIKLRRSDRLLKGSDTASSLALYLQEIQAVV